MPIALALATSLPALAGEQTAAVGGTDLPNLISVVPNEESVVVTIEATHRAGANALERRQGLSQPGLIYGRDLGSGFIIGRDGEIVTNAHVVAGAQTILVRLEDGRQFAANPVGLDTRSDIALIRIDAHDLPVALTGDSDRLKPGEWVVAIGSPFGLDRSVTAGVVSVVSRTLPSEVVPLIQSDVAINPGSSGSPLFNMQGEVVGINSMIFSTSGGYMGVSFAVPIKVALRIVDELRMSGHVSRGHIGATVQELTPELAESFGLKPPQGALVVRVTRGGPADQAGFHQGDIILSLGDEGHASYAELRQALASARPAQRLKVNVWRKRKLLSLDLTVAEDRGDQPSQSPLPPAASEVRLGLNLGDHVVTRRPGLESGLPVLEVHGAALEAGVQSDDVIVAVGDRRVQSLAEFDNALAEAPSDQPVALLVLRDGVVGYLAVRSRP